MTDDIFGFRLSQYNLLNRIGVNKVRVVRLYKFRHFFPFWSYFSASNKIYKL